MKNPFITIILGIVFLSCNQSENQRSKNLGTESILTEKLSEKNIFNEGVIDVDIHFPGNQLSALLKKIDPSKGNIQKQIEVSIAELPADEQVQMKKATQNNPFVSMQVLLAPLLKNEIFVSESKVTAKCDGLGYHLENTLDVKANRGKIFVESLNNPSNAVTFTYDESFLGTSQLQVKFDAASYQRQETDETATIAGYRCNKATYTLKKVDENPMGINQLIVWTSEQMPQSLNFIHPYYVEETNGIMKIELFTHPEQSPVLVYEFKKVTSAKVGDTAMKIKESSPVYDSKTDITTIVAKLTGILF